MAHNEKVSALAIWAASNFPLADAAPYLTAIAFDRTPRLLSPAMEAAWRWWLAHSGSETDLLGGLGSLLGVPDLELQYRRHLRATRYGRSFRPPPGRPVAHRRLKLVETEGIHE